MAAEKHDEKITYDFMKILTQMLVAASLFFTLGVASVFPQSYPSKPVRIVVPFPAGGGGDLVTRAVAARLSDQLSQSFIVDNRPGLGGNIGSELVVRSAPNGETFLMGGDHLTIGKALYPKLGYDPLKDLVPMVMFSTGPHVLVAHPSFEANNLKELIALARAKPGMINLGTPGSGTAQDMFGERFKRAAGIDIIAIRYKGGGPALVDLLAGHVKLGIIGMPPVMPLLKAGKLKLIAVTSPQRSPLFPAVESVSETFPGLSSMQWLALMAPVGTPADIVNKVVAETRKALEQPQLKELLASIGLVPSGLETNEFAKFMQEEYQVFAKVVKDYGIKVD